MIKLIFVVSVSLSIAILFPPCTYPNDKENELKISDQTPNFILEDAYGKQYELEEMKGCYVFLIFGNRGLKVENRKWAQSLKNCYIGRPDIKIFMIADMRGIPFFITKNFVREQIAKETNPVPVLIDWGQKVNELYGIDPASINIIVIDPEGDIIFRHKNSTYDHVEFVSLQTKLKFIISSTKRGN